MFLILLLFMAALSLEGIGTYISVIGLAATFAADPIILTLAVVLDFCKIIAVNTLAKSWGKIGNAIRVYLIASTLVLSLITSAGVAGYLSNSFQKAMLPNQGNDIALVNLKSEQERLYSRKKEIDQQISQLPPNQVKSRQRLMESFKPETDHINTRLIEIDTELPKLQTSQVKMHTEVGSIMYLAEVADIAPTTAVGIIIAMIVFVFDPMAIVFLITANSLLRRRKEEPEPEPPTPEKMIIDEEPEVQAIVEEPIVEVQPKPIVEPILPEVEKPIDWSKVQADYQEFIAKDPYVETISPPPSFTPQVEELKIDNVNWPYAPPKSIEEETFAKAASDLIESFKAPKAKIEDPANWPFPNTPYTPTPKLELVEIAKPEIIVDAIETLPEPIDAIFEVVKPLDPPLLNYTTDVVVHHADDAQPEPMDVQEGIDILKAALEPTRQLFIKEIVPAVVPAPEVLEPEIAEVLKEILNDVSTPLSDEERVKLDRALDKVSLDGEEERKIEELVVQQVANKVTPDAILETPTSLLEDAALDEVPNANVQYVGPMWINPKLLEIYDSK